MAIECSRHWGAHYNIKMQPEQVVKLLERFYNMLLFEMLIWCIIASVVVKYIYRLDGLATIKLCAMLYVGWFMLCVMLV